MPKQQEPRGGHARYGQTGTGGGSQDQEERKDDGFRSRQGGDQSRREGRKGEPEEPRGTPSSTPPAGTNTQGELAGIGEASRDSAARLEPRERPRDVPAERDPGAGTDQPRRMGGPLGPDPQNPRLPGGAQSSDTRGTGAGGFDRGVDAKRIGEVHQGAKVEDERDGPAPGEPGAISGGAPRQRGNADR